MSVLLPCVPLPEAISCVHFVFLRKQACINQSVNLHFLGGLSFANWTFAGELTDNNWKNNTHLALNVYGDRQENTKEIAVVMLS